MFDQHHADDVGRILLQAQNDLKNIRNKISNGNASPVDLDRVLERAENDLRAKAEIVLSAVTQNTAETLPTIQQPVDNQRNNSNNRRRRSGGRKQTSTSRVRRKVEHARSMEYILNPTSQNAREFLQGRFGIPAPKRQGHGAGQRRVPNRHTMQMRRTGAVSSPQNALPRQNRINPSAPPPEIAEEDIQKGMLNLINRGFIPPNVDLSAAFSRGPPPVTQAPVQLHDWTEQFAKTEPFTSAFGFNAATLRLDVQNPIQSLNNNNNNNRRDVKLVSKLPKTTNLDLGPNPHYEGIPKPKPRITSDNDGSQKPTVSMKNAQDVDKIRGYNELLDEYSLHQFIIRKGKTLASTPEFQSFRRTNLANWGNIITVINLLEDILSQFQVPLAYIDGKSIMQLADDELHKPSNDELLRCIVNIDQVNTMLRLPGRRYVGEEGPALAATKIQSSWRRYTCRTSYLNYQKSTIAAEAIQTGWRQSQEYFTNRARIKQKRADEEARWMKLSSDFKDRWEEIQQKRRVVIHVPSISREEHQRLTIPNFQTQQNLQMSRLCAINDPMVDVIYISPIEIAEDVMAYYEKLLEVGGIENPRLRIKIIVPENMERFPSHISLTSLLLYSPRSIKRILRFINGRDAYIVPGSLGPEERRLALRLNVPLLAPEPALANVYATKSGSKRLFALADMNTAPGAHDLYEEEEIHSALAKLIAAYIDVPRWIFKIDDEFGGRGHAYFDVKCLKQVAMLRKERAKFMKADKNYWGRPEVQEGARMRLMDNLRTVLKQKIVLCGEEVYKDWKRFVKTFTRIGGVIEACPLDVRGSPSANLLIEPNGAISLISTQDQIFSTPYRYCGCSFPQKSVPHAAIRGAALAICAKLYEKNVIGYVGIDFVTFWDAASNSQRLWAVDINIGLTRSASSFALFHFLMGGKVDTSTGEYMVEPWEENTSQTLSNNGGSQLQENSTISSLGENSSLNQRSSTGSLQVPRNLLESRCYVSHDSIYHPNLGSMQYGAFFNLCRLHGISFDLQSRNGLAFMLADSLVGGTIGMLGVGKVHSKALRSVSKCLKFIENQVGTLHQKGEFDSQKSNFMDILSTIKHLELEGNKKSHHK